MPHSLKSRIKSLCYKGEITEKERDKIIKALEQQPCEDCISREQAKDAMYALCDETGTFEENPWRDNPYIDDIIDAIEDLPSVTPKARWIPVSERLPEEGEPILFSTKTGRVYEGAYFDLSDNRQWYAYKDENYAWNNVITAWQPLPQSYRESEEQE